MVSERMPDTGRRIADGCTSDFDRRKIRSTRGIARLPKPATCSMGNRRSQPRTEFRFQPVARSRSRFRLAAGRRRHRQDPAHPCGRLAADPGRKHLPGNHHDARHGAIGRRYRFPAGHRRRENDTLDGRVDGQPGSVDQERRSR